MRFADDLARAVGKLSLTRRDFLTVLAAAAGARCSSSSNGSSRAARLRVMLNGGIYEELARKLVIAPFERDTGASVEVIPASAAQIVSRLIAERAAPHQPQSRALKPAIDQIGKVA